MLNIHRWRHRGTRWGQHICSDLWRTTYVQRMSNAYFNIWLYGIFDTIWDISLYCTFDYAIYIWSSNCCFYTGTHVVQHQPQEMISSKFSFIFIRRRKMLKIKMRGLLHWMDSDYCYQPIPMRLPITQPGTGNVSELEVGQFKPWYSPWRRWMARSRVQLSSGWIPPSMEATLIYHPFFFPH